MARKTIVQRLAIEGDDEIKRELEALGFAGVEAFRKLKAQLDQTTSPLRQFATDLDRVGKSLTRMGTSIRQTGQFLATRLTAPLLALGGASLKAFSDFESGMANVSTLIDTAAESMADMNKEVLAIAGRTPVGISDLTQPTSTG